ncbi:uncharacterized protein LOC134770492 [Penaeus indicus]|uniref:uncharacterized protein LOC134770492 n=1 Tax=Penaeus indicus TaxID=29960 RepID=UPI00300DBA53
MWSIGIVSSLLLACARAQQLVSDCPSPDGYFADSVQCDKYYDCQDNVLTEKLCPDGMAFNDLNPRIEKCDFTFQVDCAGRPELQPAQPTEVCPRQNGYFPHPDPKICNKFYYCAAGSGSLITCPDGLVFSLKTGNCVWPDAAGRSGCASTNVLNFTCPTSGFDIQRDAHPRFPDPDDCQYFYVCINGKDPRRNGCAFGQVFNSVTKACDSPKEVPECADYYSQYFDEYFQTLSSGGRVSADIIAAAIAAGYDVPDLKDRVRVATGGSGSGVTRRRGQTPAPPLDAADDTAFRAPAPSPRRPAASRPAARNEQPQRATRTFNRPRLGSRSKPTTPPTTTTPPPPPPPVDDYAYDYVYEDYPADAQYDDAAAAPAPAPTTAAPPPPSEAPANRQTRVLNRRPLVRPRN